MKNILLTIVGVVIIVTLAIIFLPSKKIPADSSTVMINDLLIKVELAQSPAEQMQGLSYRDSLDHDKGMLFIYPDKQVRTFWMNEMRFPLDIIWIRDNQIIGIEKNAPIPNSEDIPTFQSPAPVNYVLELNAGFVQKYGLKIGDGVMINLSRP